MVKSEGYSFEYPLKFYTKAKPQNESAALILYYALAPVTGAAVC